MYPIPDVGTLIIRDFNSAIITSPRANIDQRQISGCHMGLEIFLNKTMHLTYGDTPYTISAKDEEILIDELYKFLTVCHHTNTFFAGYNTSVINCGSVPYVRDFMRLSKNHTDALSITHKNITPNEHIFLLTGVMKSLIKSECEDTFKGCDDIYKIISSYLLPSDINYTYKTEAQIEGSTDSDANYNTEATVEETFLMSMLKWISQVIQYPNFNYNTEETTVKDVTDVDIAGDMAATDFS